MTRTPPLVLAYEVPDRGLPWAQALTAKLEAVARLHRVSLVPLAELDPATRHILVAPNANHLENRDMSRGASYRAIHIALSADPTDDVVVLTPEAPEVDRPLQLADLAAMLLDAHRTGDPEHPLLTLPPGVHRVALAAQPELVHDLSGALQRHMLARLGARLTAGLGAGPATFTTSPPAFPPTDPAHDLARRAHDLERAVTHAEAQLTAELEHALATHGLGAVLPALHHLERLARPLETPLRRPSPPSAAHELEAARQALARAQLAVAHLGPSLPHTLALAGVHGPVVAALGGLALGPAASFLLEPTALATVGGPFVLAGLATAALFGVGVLGARLRQRLHRRHLLRRLDDAAHDVVLAQRHQAERLIEAHEPTLLGAAVHRYRAHLAAHRDRLLPLVGKVEALASRFPPTPPDTLVEILAPPIDPWLHAIGDELTRGEHHPPTLVALESLVAARAADAARWQGRADVCARLREPAGLRLEALAQKVDALVPPGTAQRFALMPRALAATPSDHLTGFVRASTVEGLYACALLPGGR